MKKEKKGKEVSDKFSPKRDIIVKTVAQFIIPFLLVYGVYLMLNGHLSPGGGFSAGAVMGAALILFSSAFGYKKIKTVFTSQTEKRMKAAASKHGTRFSKHARNSAFWR